MFNKQIYLLEVNLIIKYQNLAEKIKIYANKQK